MMLPVTMTIGVGAVAMISRVASRPSSRGMWMSMVTIGAEPVHQLDRLAPSRASPRPGFPGRRRSAPAARAVAGPSATRTRITVSLHKSCSIVSIRSFWSNLPLTM
ncbi:MAG: hypothetical protein WKF75_00260 [Singulisphaera sp.]